MRAAMPPASKRTIQPGIRVPNGTRPRSHRRYTGALRNGARPRVLVAGAGVAGLETMLALRALTGDRVEITLLAPELKFVNRSMSVAQPFEPKRVRGVRVEDIALDSWRSMASWHPGSRRTCASSRGHERWRCASLRDARSRSRGAPRPRMAFKGCADLSWG